MAPAANISYLQGDDELVSETIRSLIAKHWNPANTTAKTPTFISMYGKNTAAAADEEAKPNDLAIRDGENIIRFLEAGSVSVLNEQSALTTSILSTVKIDIFGETQKLRQLFANEVNRIIFIMQPSSTFRIPKSTSTEDDPENSAIATFKNNMLDWTPIPVIQENGIIGQMTGSLDVKKLYYK